MARRGLTEALALFSVFMKNRHIINWKRLLSYALVSVVIGVFVTVAVLLGQYQDFRRAPLNIPESGVVYEIAAGTSLKQLAYDLQRHRHFSGQFHHDRTQDAGHPAA